MNFHNLKKMTGNAHGMIAVCREVRQKQIPAACVGEEHSRSTKVKGPLVGMKEEFFLCRGKNEGCGRWELSPMTLISVFGRRH